MSPGYRVGAGDLDDGVRVHKHFAEQLFHPLQPPWPPPEFRTSRGICCVKKFNYPRRWEAVAEEDHGYWFVGIEFEADGEYAEGGPCVCECCHFKQFVETPKFKAVYDGRVHRGTSPEPGVPQEDCWVDGEGLTGRTGKTPSQPWKAKCFGDERDFTETDDDGDIVAKNTTTRCGFEIIDRPGLHMDFQDERGASGEGGAYSATWKFIGRIYDTCRNNMVVASKTFGFSVGGNAPKKSEASDGKGKGKLSVYGFPSEKEAKPTTDIEKDGTRVSRGEGK